MKNEANRNPEQQDQLIRETFEQYRAGIESMPSQRAKIVYRMTEKHAPDCRVYYRLAAVAAALVLLLGVVVPAATGNSGLFRWPDQQRNVPDQVAAQPQPTGFVPLAQPEGTAASAEVRSTHSRTRAAPCAASRRRMRFRPRSFWILPHV